MAVSLHATATAVGSGVTSLTVSLASANDNRCIALLISNNGSASTPTYAGLNLGSLGSSRHTTSPFAGVRTWYLANAVPSGTHNLIASSTTAQDVAIYAFALYNGVQDTNVATACGNTQTNGTSATPSLSYFNTSYPLGVLTHAPPALLNTVDHPIIQEQFNATLDATFMARRGTAVASSSYNITLTESTQWALGGLEPKNSVNVGEPLVGRALGVAGGTMTPAVSSSPMLVGRSTTLAGGTMGVSRTHALPGQSVALGQGTLTPQVGDQSVALTGQAATTQHGTMASSTSGGGALTGQGTPLAGGTMGVSLSVALTGLAVTAAGGVAGVDRTHALVGHNLAAAGGTAGTELVQALAGQSVVSAQGTLGAATTFPQTGQAATTSQGTLRVEIAIPLAGQTLTAAPGTLVDGVPGVVRLTGQGVTTSGGTITGDGQRTSPLTATVLDTYLGIFGGQMTPSISAEVQLQGLALGIGQGTTGAGWFPTNTAQAAGWANANTNQTPGWQTVATRQTPGWTTTRT